MVRTYVKKGGHGGARVVEKRSHEFALTLNDVDWEKSHTGWWFSQDSNILDICVAEEPYHPPLDCDSGTVVDDEPGRHQHIYLRFEDGMRLEEVRTLVLTLVDDKGFDLQVCKSRRNWLIYITKEDGHPYLKNVKVSELSLFARSNHHIKTTYRVPKPINKADAFMLSCGNFRNSVIDMANVHLDALRRDIQSRRQTLQPNMGCGWSRKIVKCLSESDKHLYIYGEPGVGKTELVDRFTQIYQPWRCGFPDKWVFGTLKENDEFALFEDFDTQKVESVLPQLLSIMDKKPVAISQKYVDDATKLFKCRCIFISNYQLPMHHPMYRRCDYVQVDHKMFECVYCNDKI